MKNVGKYVLPLTLVILVIYAFVATSSISSVKAASSVSMKTGPGDFTKTGKTIQILNNQRIKQGQTFTSVFMNTQGYQNAALYIKVIGSSELYVSGQFSIDRINGYDYDQSVQNQLQVGVRGAFGQLHYTMAPFALLGPMFRIMVFNEPVSTYPLATVSATLYLIS